MRKEISIILPVYNEEGNIRKVVSSIIDFMLMIARRFEVIIVDDGSADKTYPIVEELSRVVSYINVVHHKKNMGYGVALRSGFELAKYPLVFFMDSDGQFNISEILKLMPYSDDFDAVVGVRAIRKDPFYRVIIGKLYNEIICFVFRMRIKDVACGFKLLKKTIIEEIITESRGGVINVEILLKAMKRGFLIKEVCVIHLPRTRGKQTGARPMVFLGKILELIILWKKYVILKNV